jgi:ferredoxin
MNRHAYNPRHETAFPSRLNRKPASGEAVKVDVISDPDLCIGSGECIRLVPEAFELDEEAGVSHPLPAAARTDPERLRATAAACPTGAISLIERTDR